MTIGGQDDGAEVLRAFIALELPQEVREAIARAQAVLKDSGSRVSWVPVENLHLTLAFLGDTFASQLPPLQQSLDIVASNVEPFTFPVEGVGVFGPTDSPRIVWAGIREVPRPMMQLNEALQGALKGLGYRLDNKPFKPHVTIGRIRSSRGLGALTSLLASVRNSPFGEVQVQRVLLMRSHLDEAPVRYSIMHASSLKGTASHGS